MDQSQLQKSVRFAQDSRNQRLQDLRNVSRGSNNQKLIFDITDQSQQQNMPIQSQPIHYQQQGRQNNYTAALSELRNTFNQTVQNYSASRVSEVNIPLNETIQTVHTTPSRCLHHQQHCQPLQPMSQNLYSPHQSQAEPYIIYQQSSEKKIEKKKKKQKQKYIEEVEVTPKKRPEPIRQTQMRDPDVDNLRSEIRDLERSIRNMENRPPPTEQREVQILVEDDTKDKECMKKLCKKIKKLEKDLYEVSRQRDEALIIRTTLERENQEMFDRVGELEALLKQADKKIFDLSIMNERFTSYQKQLEDEVSRLQKKKKKRSPPEIREVIIEKIVERPIEIIQHIPVDRIVEKPMQVIKEIQVDRIVDRIVEVPKIEYIDRPVTQYIERIKEVPVERRVEVPVYHERIVEVPVDRIVFHDRIVEVPVDRIVNVPYEKIIEVPIIKEVFVDKIRDVPREVIKEVPRIQYVDRPVYVEVPVDRRVEVPVEVPVDRIIERRDDREILRLMNENADLLQNERNLRDRLQNCIQELNHVQNNCLDIQDRERLVETELEQKFIQLQQTVEGWQNRCMKLEDTITRERTIVMDLQNRLDQMYQEVEKLTSENNRKNEEFQRHLLRVQEEYKRRLESQNQIFQQVQQQGQIIQVSQPQMQPQLISQQLQIPHFIQQQGSFLPQHQLTQIAQNIHSNSPYLQQRQPQQVIRQLSPVQNQRIIRESSPNLVSQIPTILRQI